MARKARLVIAGQAMHLLVRGHNRQIIFNDDADCRIYLDWLRDAAKEFGCGVHAFALM
ncbi:MAG: transposase, partial [Burkholderiaceae bacterium]|nr:transposase [Burkholderiaceae bacterium]